MLMHATARFAGLTPDVHTDPRDWAGLHANDTNRPSGVPGVQINGYFPDDSTFNTLHGWNHDAQFVLRLPNAWNGKLVVTGCRTYRCHRPATCAAMSRPGNAGYL
jgi:hypothetical protein